MKRLPQRIRGIVGTAITWAGAWSVVGAGLGSMDVAGLDLYAKQGLLVAIRAVAEPTLACAVAGAVCGALFSSVLILAERRRRGIDDLRLGRVAALGAIGAMFLPLAFAALVPTALLSAKFAAITGAFAFLGGGSAAATLALARRGAPGKLPLNHTGGLLRGRTT